MDAIQEQLEKQKQQELADLQSPRRRSNKIGLGILHNDLQKLNTTLDTLPKANRADLPQVVISMGGQKLDPRNPKELEIIKRLQETNPGILQEVSAETKPAPEEPEVKTAETDAERIERLTRIGNVMQERLSLGSANKTMPEIGKTVFDNFIEQTKNREELLADATREQSDLFKKLEETIISLRDANSAENKELRKTLDDLSGQLEASPETKAKSQLTQVVKQAKESAKPSFGARVLGRAESWIESKRSPGFEEMFKPAQAERKRELAGILEVLTGQNTQKETKTKPAATASSKVPGWAKILSPTALAPKVAAASPMVPNIQMPDTISIESIGTLNVKAQTVNVTSDELMPGADLIPDIDKGTVKGEKKAPKGTVKGSAKPQYRDARGRFAKAPTPKASIMSRFGGKALGAAGAGLSGYMAYDENLYRGTGTAAGIGAATGGGALAGAAAGAALGTMVAPGVGTIVGGLIGGGLGAFGAQSASEAIADKVAAPTVTPVQNLQGQSITTNSTTNNELKRTENKPVVVLPAPAAPVVNQNSSPVLLPRGNIRPSENAFDRYLNRSTAFL